MAMSSRTKHSLPGYLMAFGRLTDVDRRPALRQRQPTTAIRATAGRRLTVANTGPYIRSSRTRTTDHAYHPSDRPRHDDLRRPRVRARHAVVRRRGVRGRRQLSGEG